MISSLYLEPLPSEDNREEPSSEDADKDAESLGSGIDRLRLTPNKLLFFKPESVIIEFREAETDDGEIKLDCFSIIFSSWTRRILFVSEVGKIILQRRVYLDIPGGDNPGELYRKKKRLLQVTLRNNPLYRGEVTEVTVRLKNEGDYDKFIAEYQNLYQGVDSRVMPEVLIVHHDCLIPCRDLPVLKWIADVFTDIVLRNGHEIFMPIALNFTSPSRHQSIDTKKMVLNVIRSQGLPRIIISEHQIHSPDAMVHAERLPVDHQPTRAFCTLMDTSSIQQLPIPVTEPQFVTDLIYDAHVRGQSSRDSSAIHIHRRLIGLLAAAQEAEIQKQESSSLLAALAAFKVTLVRELAHWFVTARLTETPDLQGEDWVTWEMLDAEGNSDAGAVVEVLWLGHCINLIYGEDGHLHVFARNDKGGLVRCETPPHVEKHGEHEEVQRTETSIETDGDEGQFITATGYIIKDETLNIFRGRILPSPKGRIFVTETGTKVISLRAKELSKLPRRVAATQKPKASPGSKLFTPNHACNTEVRVRFIPRPRDVFDVSHNKTNRSTG